MAVSNAVAGKPVLWKINRHTRAKHTILRKYLDAWLPILGAGRSAHRDVVLIDAFAGPGRYEGGEDGSPIIMLKAYLEHSAELAATPHFFFIEENPSRYARLRDEVAAIELESDAQVEVIEGSFGVEFPQLVKRLRATYRPLPPAFAFIDPFGAGDLPEVLSTPLLAIPRCEVLVYVPIGFLARFAETPEFEPIMESLYGGGEWRAVTHAVTFEEKKRILHDLFLKALQARVSLVRSFEITRAHEAGGNTYYLFFGTDNPLGMTRMKDAMWKVDPAAGQAFKDSTLIDHPVLFEQKPDFSRLQEMLRNHFGNRWFTIEEAEQYTLRETPFRHNAHLRTPLFAPAEKSGAIEVVRPVGKRASSFTAGTRIRFAKSGSGELDGST